MKIARSTDKNANSWLLLFVVIACGLTTDVLAQTAPSGCAFSANPTALPNQGGTVVATVTCSSAPSGLQMRFNCGPPNPTAPLCSATAQPSQNFASKTITVPGGSPQGNVITLNATACDAGGEICNPVPNPVIITIAAVVPVTISPTTLPLGTASVQYSQTITASGGVPPFIFDIVATGGTLPPGLVLRTLSGTSASISGIPTTAGTFNFQVSAKDSSATDPAIQNYIVAIAPAPPPSASQVTVVSGNNQIGTPGQPLSQDIVVLVTNSSGTAIQGAVVTWVPLVAPGGEQTDGSPAGFGTFNPTSGPSNAQGLASSRFSMGSNPGGRDLLGCINYNPPAPAPCARFRVNAAAPPATGSLQLVSGDNQVVGVSTAVPAPLVAKVVDTKGNAVSGAAVTWAPGAGGGSVTSSTNTSDALGLVHATFTTGPGTQDNTIVVTAIGSGSQLTFTVRNQQSRVTVPATQVITPQAATAVGAPTTQLNNVRQRLDQLRLASSPTSAQGFRASFDGLQLPAMSAFALAPTKDSNTQSVDGEPRLNKPATGGGAAADAPSSAEHWGVFINGDVDIGRQSTTGTKTGFKINSKGVTVGTDYRFTGNSVLGASLGFLKGDTTLDAGAGTQDAKGYSFSFYGSYVPTENAYIDGILTLGHNRYNSQRQTPAASFDSSTSGNQIGVAISAGYAFNQGPLALTPYGRVEYVDAKVNGFTENGDPDQALMIGEQRIKATTLSIGGTASYAISTSWGVLLPYGRLEFQHLAQSNSNNVSVQIASDVSSTPTQIQLLGQDKSFGNFALGLTALFGHGVSAFFNYQQLFGKSNTTDQLYTLGLRAEF